jgi:hypothetical protein
VLAAIPQAPGVCDGQNGVDFIGFPPSGPGGRPTVILTLGANQTITASSSLTLGSGASAVSNLSLNLCYQDTSSGAISAVTDTNGFGLPGTWLSLPANTNMPYSITRSFTDLTPATYEVGLCGCIDGSDAWVTDWGWLSVQVFQL